MSAEAFNQQQLLQSGMINTNINTTTTTTSTTTTTTRIRIVYADSSDEDDADANNSDGAPRQKIVPVHSDGYNFTDKEEDYVDKLLFCRGDGTTSDKEDEGEENNKVNADGAPLSFQEDMTTNGNTNKKNSAKTKKNAVFITTTTVSTNRGGGSYFAPSNFSSSSPTTLPQRRNREEQEEFRNNNRNQQQENGDEVESENDGGIDNNSNLPDQYRAEVSAWEKHQGHVLEKDGYRWNLDPSEFYEDRRSAKNDLLNACLTAMDEAGTLEAADANSSQKEPMGESGIQDGSGENMMMMPSTAATSRPNRGFADRQQQPQRHFPQNNNNNINNSFTSLVVNNAEGVENDTNDGDDDDDEEAEEDDEEEIEDELDNLLLVETVKQMIAVCKQQLNDVPSPSSSRENSTSEAHKIEKKKTSRSVSSCSSIGEGEEQPQQQEQIEEKQVQNNEIPITNAAATTTTTITASSRPQQQQQQKSALEINEEAASGRKFREAFRKFIETCEPVLLKYEAKDLISSSPLENNEGLVTEDAAPRMSIDEFFDLTAGPMAQIQRILRQWCKPPTAPKVIVDGVVMDI